MSLQRHAEAEGDVIRGYQAYAKIRIKQINTHNETERLKISEINDQDDDKNKNDVDDDDNTEFWKSVSHHTPEDRVAIASQTLKAKKINEKSREENVKPDWIPKLFNNEGKPYNINQAKVRFHLNDEDDREKIILEVSIYRCV